MDLDPLIDRFRGPLIGLIASWGASSRDAIELAQDVFAEAYLSRDRFEGDWNDLAAAGAWLRGIASNLHRSSVRRRERDRVLNDGELRETAEESESPDPRGESLLAAMSLLRDSWKTVLHMRYVEGSGLAEIAALLGVSERSVEGRLHRARNELRLLLEAKAVSVPNRASDRAEDPS